MACKAKRTTNSIALSRYLGSRLLPGMDGKPQRKLSAKEAYEMAVKERSEHGEQED